MHTIEGKISGQTRAIIDAYLALPVGAKPSCPYFNNRRRKVRGSLRVLKGKGTPQEIAEEVKIDAKLLHVDIAALSTDKLKEFMVSRDLGVDCSGFAYHVLDAFCRETIGKSISSCVSTLRGGFVGRLIGQLRPAENVGVATFTHEKNSALINASQTRPGDFISMISCGPDKQHNHMLVVTGVEEAETGLRISYAHSIAWPSDGHFGHGVREGEILVKGEDLLGGIWKEKGMIGPENTTHQSALGAKEVSVRRLHCLT
ncbi:MAG TPA: hypothetical protein VIR98_02760 [Candidatus Paceibacterota bacterium]|jgi:hypothetical protein